MSLRCNWKKTMFLAIEESKEIVSNLSEETVESTVTLSSFWYNINKNWLNVTI